MKVTFNWLKQYVDFDWSPEQLAEKLTMAGIEVEGIVRVGGEFEGVVVAQILSSQKHPNADKLTLCSVADGQGERQIVCRAKNYQAGDKAPLALPGCTLPTPEGAQPFTIKIGKIRGVESHGMMCSPKQLGLAEDDAGLMILPQEAKVGQAFAEYLGRSVGDVVYDLEITPNRPDLNSVIGIAREISALTGNRLKLPELTFQDPAAVSQEPADKYVAVRIDDIDLCPRYNARVILGVKIGPSPDWLKCALEKVGIRSISNVVDATNYVMLETGQPLHAFDYHLLETGAVAAHSTPQQGARPTVVIRRAFEGEMFTTLDGQKRTLTNQILVIADETKAIALAGVMGGLNSEINEQTVDVLIESACFKAQNIRATSKKLDLRSDASYRFERGSDIEICDWASQRAAQLMLQTAGGTLLKGAVDAYPDPAAPREIMLRHNKAGQLLGVKIPSGEQTEYLRRLGLELADKTSACPSPALAAQTSDSTTFRIPSFRIDLKREVDLIEEIGRLYGVERIPATAPRGAVGKHDYDVVHDQLAEARNILCGLGLHEAQGQTLISESSAGLATALLSESVAHSKSQPNQRPPETRVPLANPLSGDMSVLRPSLVPGLLDALQRNFNHRNPDIALFEIGRVFIRRNDLPEEERRLAIALTGLRQPGFWNSNELSPKFDFFDLKGFVEVFCEQFGLRGLHYSRRTETTALLTESAIIQLGKNVVGEFGQLLPPLAKDLDLPDAVFVAELNLDLLLAYRSSTKSFKPLPAYPEIRRDVAMVVSEAVTHQAVLDVIKKLKPPHLVTVDLFDVFRGKHMPAGQKSVAYAFTYRSHEQTLTDAEVNTAHKKVVEQLKQQLQAVIREG